MQSIRSLLQGRFFTFHLCFRRCGRAVGARAALGLALIALTSLLSAGCSGNRGDSDSTKPDAQHGESDVDSGQSAADDQGSADTAETTVPDSKEYPRPAEETVENLIQYLNDLANTADPNDRKALQDFITRMEARVLGAKRLAQLENDVDLQSHIIAAETRLESLRLLSMFDAPNVEARTKTYTEAMKEVESHEDPAIARIGRLSQLYFQLDQLYSGAGGDAEELAKAVRQALESEEHDERLLFVTRNVAEMMASIDRPEVGIPLLRDIGEAFRKSDDPDLSADGYSVLNLADSYELERKLSDTLSDVEGAADDFTEAFRDILGRPSLNATLAMEMANHLVRFEQAGHLEQALRLNTALQQASDKIGDPNARDEILSRVGAARKRLELLGRELPVRGVQIDGSPFDWSTYQGKVVLLDFWASWCGPCLAELPNIKQVYDDYHEAGFDVIGINLDDSLEEGKAMADQKALPWATVVSEDPEYYGFANPLAQQCGVQFIPFLVLIDRDGKVSAIHTRGAELALRVGQLIEADSDDLEASGKPADEGPDAVAEPPTETPAVETEPSETGSEATPMPEAPAEEPAAEEPATEEPVTEEPATEEPATEEPVTEEPVTEEPATEEPATEEPATEEPATEEPAAEEPVTEESGDTGEGDTESAAAQEPSLLSTAVNPYEPPEDMTPVDLVTFLFEMEDKPRSIQFRDGFADGVANAADRILASDDAKEKYRVIAATTKLRYLHRDACLGKEEADRRLAASVEELATESSPEIIQEVAFFREERRALQSADIAAEQLAERVQEFQDYFVSHQAELSSRHLRMASATVDLINRIEDAEQRETHFASLGKALSSSEDKAVARYGRRLGSQSAPAESELIGKPLELAGATADGQPLNWDSYRGSVVLVDFWATWCGPCRAAMPELQEIYQTYQTKGLRVVGVNLDQDSDALATFLEQTPLPWAQLIGEEASQAADRYGVRGIPTLMLVDREGKVLAVAHHLHEVRQQLESQFDAG